MHPRASLAPAIVAAVLAAGLFACTPHSRGGLRRDAAARQADTPAAASTSAGDAELEPDGSDGAIAELPHEMAGPLRACIDRVRAQTPPELAAALDMLEYGTAASDACRVDLAFRMHAPALCDGIVLSSVRSQCALRVAVARAAPDECPIAPADRGHDPVCVALASHAVGLCASAPRADALRCVAIFRGDERACDPLDELMRDPCRRDVTLFRDVVPRRAGAPDRPGTLRVRLAFGADPDASTSRVFDLDLAARGAYYDPAGTLSLVDPVRGWPSRFAVTGPDRPAVGIALAVPSRPGPATLVDLRIVTPDGLVIEPAPGGAHDVHFTQVAHGRGEAVAGHAVIAAFATGLAVRVEIDFATFVRDVVSRDRLEAP